MFKKLTRPFFVLTLFACQFLYAADFKPGIIYGMGSKFDKSFNEAAYHGIDMFKAETGIDYKEFELSQPAQGEQFLRHLIKKGTNFIIVIGYDMLSALEKVSMEYPEIKFVLIDAIMDKPNIQSIVFKDEQGSFMVGALAGYTTQTNKIGFIGGMDVPAVRRFGCGFYQGAHYVNKDVKLYENMIGTTASAWSDPAKASELAKSQFDRGVDIVYAAAGKSGLGVLQAAADNGKLAIGVDVNQNGLFPGSVLTSMEKKVDVATYTTLMDGYSGTWSPGVRIMGLSESGVGWSLDEYNVKLVPANIKNELHKIQEKIIKGQIDVVDYVKKGACPL